MNNFACDMTHVVSTLQSPVDLDISWIRAGRASAKLRIK